MRKTTRICDSLKVTLGAITLKEVCSFEYNINEKILRRLEVPLQFTHAQPDRKKEAAPYLGAEDRFRGRVVCLSGGGQAANSRGVR